MPGRCGQLRLLLWKNTLLKTRHPLSTCFELLIPLIAISILIIIRSLVSIDDVELTIVQEPHTITRVEPYFLNSLSCGHLSSARYYRYLQIAFVADGPEADSEVVQGLMEDVRIRLQTIAEGMEYRNDCCIDSGWNNTCPGPIDQTYFLPGNITAFYPSQQALEDYYMQDGYAGMVYEGIHSLAMAVVVTKTGTADQPSWSYTLRANNTELPYTGLAINPFINTYNEISFYQYYTNNILTLQYWIDAFIITHPYGNASLPSEPSLLPDLNFLPFPISPHQSDNFASYLQPVIGLFMVCAFMWPFSRLVRNMVEEKEKKLKEGMKMMGLFNSVFWLSWLITYVILFFVLCILICLLTHFTFMKHSNPLLIFMFLYTFCLSLLTLSMLVTTFFTRAKTAGTLSPFILILMYLPYFGINDSTKDMNSKNATCILSPVAFSLGTVNIINWESIFVGAQFTNTHTIVDNFQLNTAISLMFFDFLFYGLLALYFDAVWPTEYGTQLPWYFIISPRWWSQTCSRWWSCCLPSNRPHSLSPTLNMPLLDVNEEQYHYMTPNIPSPHHIAGESEIEPVPASLQSSLGLQIRSLRKEFPNSENKKQPVVAVSNLNLDLYSGQIFVLLGHNGAGKTTTIQMLTGMIPPTSGTATIYGRDIVNDMSAIRSFLGVCPQHDVLWEDMTVSEHLLFFGRLKGVPMQQLPLAVMEAIEEVKLTSKAHELASSLSGGQRRRLSLAISLIGDSKVVFLDEPTSGVDPFSRRAIWDLLTLKKESRIIILTTHFMDEADQLGDRIGIMHKGGLKCCGTSLFLKRRYGVGYQMTITKNSVRTSTMAIMKVVHELVTEATLLSDIGNEVTISLPFSVSSIFPTLLQTLDEEKQRLEIQSYALSVTTLEEVFIKVAQEQAHTVDQARQFSSQRLLGNNKQNIETHTNNTKSSEEQHGEDEAQMEMDTLSSHPNESYFLRHFQALLLKRWHIQKRDKRALCCQMIVPLLLLGIGMGILRVPPNYNFPDISLSTEQQFAQPLFIPYNQEMPIGIVENVRSEDGIMEVLDVDTRYTDGNTPFYHYALEILNNASDHETSQYGGYYFNATASYFPDIPFLLPMMTVLSNISAAHGLPTFLNILSSSVLRNFTNDTTANIDVAVHPFSFTARQKEFIEDLNGIFSAIVISFGFSFIPASFAVFIVSEREYKSKHLQLISGVSMISYWVSNYLWDFICFLIPGSLGAVIVYAYGNPDFVGVNFIPVCTTFLFYGLSVIPFTYMCSFLFTSHSTAQNVMIMIYLIGGIILTMTAFALYVIPTTHEAAATYVRHLFRIIPNYCLGDAIFYLSARTLTGKGRWDMDVTGYDIVFMSCEAIVYFLITIGLEYLTNMPQVVAWFKKDPAMKDTMEAEDEDVTTERERLQNTYGGQGQRKEEGGTREGEDLIRLEGLRKVYPSKTAVKDLWFGVPAGTCFGFLGVNGAGKSTTLKMLTGDVIPSAGRGFIGGFDIARHPSKVRRLMGYCPQFDALHGELTGIETLQFYGRLRGIPAERLDSMVEYLIDRLSLREYANRPTGTYSGGNRRKVCVGIALIGNPPVVLLDEPSTGMDPVSRRFMWDFISATMSHRAVILTTHSMEECEALCNRIGMLVSGQLKCIGTAQHLKTRFGRGFQLHISTGGNDIEPARIFVQQTFLGCEEIECYGSNLKYKIPAEANVSLKEMFRIIEENKEKVGITEYSVGQTTLEQLFIQFAKTGDDQPDLLEHAAAPPSVPSTPSLDVRVHRPSFVAEVAPGTRVRQTNIQTPRR